MKKINLLIIFVLAGTIGFITSCKKDPVEYAAPTITFTVGEQTVDEGTDVSIVFKVTTEDELSKVRLYKDGDVYGEVITEFSNKQEYSFNEVVDTATTATFTFKVVAEDSQDVSKLSDAQVTITVNPVGNPVVKTTTSVKLFTAPGDQSGNESRFASLTPDFDTYSWNSAVSGGATAIATIDLLYYNGNYTKDKGTSYPHFLSPDTKTTTYDIHNNETLTDANTTYFKKLTGTDSTTIADAWSNIDDDTEIDAITGITEVNVTWNDSGDPGTIIAFKLNDGKKGVIKVGNAVDGGGTPAGEYYHPTYDYIEFDVIVQQNAPAK